ncbi:MAG TPA: tol-pal system protein YbgF [Dokdonella sp.]|uniref:tol-pal system protein YbgF n=1 Tax=Dokdonella sp. TaxID=2291710 RepID=UPI002CA6CF11|nr:tol-pal system protein YbgF [Dokdonella sp.]HUD43532.1 tol-pal system protein YbgF [Dokdonella sp.]
MQAAQRRLKQLGAATLAVAALFAVPAQAQRLSLAERVAALEAKSGPGNAQNSIELVNQNQQLQNQIQQLQGQIEELQNQVEQLKKNNRDQYIDLDSRLGRLEGGAPAGNPAAAGAATNDNQLDDIQLGGTTSGAAAAAGSTPAPSAPAAVEVDPTLAAAPAVDPADPAAESAAYDAAFSALKSGGYAEAERRFLDFIAQYPNSPLVGNAYFWLGRAYFVTQDYARALDAFQILVSRYPNNPKAADGLLNVGNSQYELKQLSEAETTLNQVIERYPNTEAARQATARLRAITLDRGR